jgi:hypothetical protein
MTAMFPRIIPVIKGQFFSGLDISKGDNPDSASGEFCYTIRITGMIDVAGGISENLPINIILPTEGKNIDIPLVYALGTFCFGNPLAYVLNNPGVFFDILGGKQSSTDNT